MLGELGEVERLDLGEKDCGGELGGVEREEIVGYII